jgi:thiol-disulfide isomerase/thioredoxin
MKFSKKHLGIAVIAIIMAFSIGANQGATSESRSMLARSEVFTDTYQPYTKELFDTSRAKGDTVVLFFWAPWCSTCSIHDTDFKEHASDIPKGVLILRVHFDNEVELKKELNVIHKDTFIAFTKEKGEVGRWIGSTFEDTMQRIKILSL